MLSSLVDNSLTDKNTTHSYLDLYSTLLSKRKESAKNILEIGIGDFTEKNGGSIKLWRDYFTNATIYGLDILPIERVIDELRNDSRVVLYTSTDAYNEEFFTTTFLNKNIKFDFMLDDGPHTLESMLQFIKLYSQVMAPAAILMIEDVKSLEWAEALLQCVPQHLKQYVMIYDLRKIKNRSDDILFVFKRVQV